MFDTDTKLPEVHHNEPLGGSILEAICYREVAISNCPMGCKIYQHETTGQQVVGHNANYNCRR